MKPSTPVRVKVCYQQNLAFYASAPWRTVEVETPMLEESISVWPHREWNKTPVIAIHAMLVLKLNLILSLYFVTSFFHLCKVQWVCVCFYLGMLWEFGEQLDLFEGVLRVADRPAFFYGGVNCVNPQMALMSIISLHLLSFSVSQLCSNDTTSHSSQLNPFLLFFLPCSKCEVRSGWKSFFTCCCCCFCCLCPWAKTPFAHKHMC